MEIKKAKNNYGKIQNIFGQAFNYVGNDIYHR